MKSLSASVLNSVKQHFWHLRQQRFFSDRLSVGLMAGALLLNVATLAVLAAKLRPLEFSAHVPVHYSNLSGGFDVLGPWYLNYRIGFFALAVTIANTYLAVSSFSRSRITSFYLLAGAVVVAIFSLIISAAFTVVL